MMKLLRIGMVSAYGLGMETLVGALKSPDLRQQSIRREEIPSLRVHLEDVPDKTVIKKLRRAGRLSKMAVLAAHDALRGVAADPERMGLVFATALGPHPTTFGFLDDIIQYGDANVSPTTFSNSVHNAPAAYVAETAGIRGPTLTVTRFFHAFHEALRLAECWLDEGRCDQVLVGAAEEHGEVLQYVLDTMQPGSGDRMTNPLVPGEGSVFFLLGRMNEAPGLCILDSVFKGGDENPYPRHDLRIIETDGLLPEHESRYTADMQKESAPIACYTHVYGSLLTGSAFSAAIASRILQDQYLYGDHPGAGQKNEDGREVSGPLAVGSVLCERLNCYAEKMLIYMTRYQDAS